MCVSMCTEWDINDNIIPKAKGSHDHPKPEPKASAEARRMGQSALRMMKSARISNSFFNSTVHFNTNLSGKNNSNRDNGKCKVEHDENTDLNRWYRNYSIDNASENPQTMSKLSETSENQAKSISSYSSSKKISSNNNNNNNNKICSCYDHYSQCFCNSNVSYENFDSSVQSTDGLQVQTNETCDVMEHPMDGSGMMIRSMEYWYKANSYSEIHHHSSDQISPSNSYRTMQVTSDYSKEDLTIENTYKMGGMCPSWAQYSQCLCVVPPPNGNFYDNTQSDPIHHHSSGQLAVSSMPHEMPGEIQQLEETIIRNYGHIFQTKSIKSDSKYLTDIDDTRVNNLETCYMDPLTNGGSVERGGGNDMAIINTAITTTTAITSTSISSSSSSSSSSTDIMSPPIGDILSDISSHIEPSAIISEGSIKEEFTANTVTRNTRICTCPPDYSQCVCYLAMNTNSVINDQCGNIVTSNNNCSENYMDMGMIVPASNDSGIENVESESNISVQSGGNVNLGTQENCCWFNNSNTSGNNNLLQIKAVDNGDESCSKVKDSDQMNIDMDYVNKGDTLDPIQKSEGDACSNLIHYSQLFYLLPSEYNTHYNGNNMVQNDNSNINNNNHHPSESTYAATQNGEIPKQLEDSIIRNYGHIFQFDYDYDYTSSAIETESNNQMV
ncbi:uncharacterized protein LOC141855467 isoform X2 [Brevipalpus obovatus]|uniref:uncharacterized protein LOC141855467 isoform X2 n=1 Tax=Brevipalpus obovatus TaxID=246614 RepID=UPI003D9F187A